MEDTLSFAYPRDRRFYPLLVGPIAAWCAWIILCLIHVGAIICVHELGCDDETVSIVTACFLTIGKQVTAGYGWGGASFYFRVRSRSLCPFARQSIFYVSFYLSAFLFFSLSIKRSLWKCFVLIMLLLLRRQNEAMNLNKSVISGSTTHSTQPILSLPGYLIFVISDVVKLDTYTRRVLGPYLVIFLMYISWLKHV